MRNFLTQTERDTLKRKHKKERDKRVCDRIKAVLLYDEGWSHEAIAKVLLVSDEAIRQHIQDYDHSHKLKPENGGSVSKLSQQDTQALLKQLREHIYLYTKDIVAYVKTVYGVEYSISGMTEWLKAHNFSYKKPAVVPGKANREAQEQWIKAYQKLKANLPSDESICFLDGVHPTHNMKLTYGWIPTGERKEIPTNTGRQRLNISGAIDIVSKKVLSHVDITLNAESTITFLKKIEAAYLASKKVHVFCDNARYYRNKDVLAYLTTSKIEMHFLPPYSPNLNPIERLWKFVYERVLYNKYYEKFADFKESILGFIDGLFDPCTEIWNAVDRRVTDNFRAVGSSMSPMGCHESI